MPQLSKIFVLSVVGGLLGVFFMVPLRKHLIVREHGRLPYPEGTACAEVLVVSETGGGKARAAGRNAWQLLAVSGLPQDQLKIDEQDWDLVAVDGKDYDLVAVAGKGLGNSSPHAWNGIAARGAAKAWREYNIAFDTWLPLR